MITVFAVFLLTLLVITGFGIVQAVNLFVAVMLMGIFSLQMAAIFFILDAADVALTEAAVGAGISTVLFLGALALTPAEERRRTHRRWLSLCVVAVTTLIVLYATFDKPRLGDPNAPVHQHVAPWYLENTPKLIDIPNVVTAVLASFRGYDTLGEVFVIFTAGVGVMFVLGTPWSHLASARTPLPETKGLRHHLVPRVVGRLLVPFIVLFGLYIQFHGDYGPGGGFQAGALIAAGLILYALLEGETESLRVVPARLLLAMVALGPLIFGGVGVVAMLLGGRFLDYSVLSADSVAGQQLGILLIEAGVGVTVVGVLVSVFHAFAARELKK